MGRTQHERGWGLGVAAFYPREQRWQVPVEGRKFSLFEELKDTVRSVVKFGSGWPKVNDT